MHPLVPLKRKYCTSIQLKTVGLFIVYYLPLTSSSTYCWVYVTVQSAHYMVWRVSSTFLTFGPVSVIFLATPQVLPTLSQWTDKFTTGSPDFHYTAYSTSLTLTQKLRLNKDQVLNCVNHHTSQAMRANLIALIFIVIHRKTCQSFLVLFSGPTLLVLIIILIISSKNDHGRGVVFKLYVFVQYLIEM